MGRGRRTREGRGDHCYGEDSGEVHSEAEVGEKEVSKKNARDFNEFVMADMGR